MARRITRAAEKLRGVVLAVVFALCSVLYVVPVTPKGIQCPTAPVQSVTEVVASKDSTGKVVEQSIKRMPREGEKGFLQCRCAEKRAAEGQDRKESNESKRFCFIAIFLPLIDTKFQLSLGNDKRVITFLASICLSNQTEPLIPPPKFV